VFRVTQKRLVEAVEATRVKLLALIERGAPDWWVSQEAEIRTIPTEMLVLILVGMCEFHSEEAEEERKQTVCTITTPILQDEAYKRGCNKPGHLPRASLEQIYIHDYPWRKHA